MSTVRACHHPEARGLRRAPRVVGRILLALLLVAGCALGPEHETLVSDAQARTGSTDALARAIRSRLRKAGIQDRRAGVLVIRRGAQPEVRVSEGHTQALIPASVAKVLTATTALDLLGPGYVFRTTVTARGSLRDGVLAGDLIVHGVGDPHGLSGAGRKPLAALEALAQQIRRAGITRVEGALVIDDLGFDQAFTHDAWTDEDRTRSYGAGVAALAFHEGVLEVQATGAARDGHRAKIRFPATPGLYEIVNDVRTKAQGRDVLGASFRQKGRALHLRGSVRPTRKASARIPVPDPATFAGGAFLRVLSQSGVSVKRGVRRARDDRDAHPGREVASLETPLAPVLRHMNVESDNFYASMVFKACGLRLTGHGSWVSGGEAVRAMLARRHIAPGDTQIVDGSGLAPTNRVSAGVIAQLLLAFDEDPLRGPLLKDSLPVAGKSGTLARRLRERGVKGRVHAKTGTLNDVRVRALAGYVAPASSRDAGHLFAILLNGRGASRVVLDDIVREIARR